MPDALEAARYDRVSARAGVCTAQRLAAARGAPAGLITERNAGGAGPAVRLVARHDRRALCGRPGTPVGMVHPGR